MKCVTSRDSYNCSGHTQCLNRQNMNVVCEQCVTKTNYYYEPQHFAKIIITHHSWHPLPYHQITIPKHATN